MLIRRLSPITHTVTTLDVAITPYQYSDIVNRVKPIEQIAPNLTEDEKEFLTTGIPPHEWREFFEDAVKEN